MIGPNQFDWTALDQSLKDAIDRHNHVIWCLLIHRPGDARLHLPQFLIDGGVRLVDTGKCVYYNDTVLLVALRQFITDFCKRFDGAKGLAFIQLGIWGIWGEWHTSGISGILSEETIDRVIGWYANHGEANGGPMVPWFSGQSYESRTNRLLETWRHGWGNPSRATKGNFPIILSSWFSIQTKFYEVHPGVPCECYLHDSS
jgi:hypothetical protein